MASENVECNRHNDDNQEGACCFAGLPLQAKGLR